MGVWLLSVRARGLEPPRPNRALGPQPACWSNRALWVLAGTTGMRRGELLGLRWGDLDLDGYLSARCVDKCGGANHHSR